MDTFSQRIKFLRNYLNKTREEFGKFVDFPEMTIRSWEYKNIIPSNKSLQKLLQNLLSQNVSISHDWLTTGNGLNPFSSKHSSEVNEDLKSVFLERNPNAFCFMISHNRYVPYFKKNELVCAAPVEEIDHLDFIIILKKDRREEHEIKQIMINHEKNLFIVKSLDAPDDLPITYSKDQDLTIYKIVFNLDSAFL